MSDLHEAAVNTVGTENWGEICLLGDDNCIYSLYVRYYGHYSITPALSPDRRGHSLTLLPGPPPTLVVCGGCGATSEYVEWKGCEGVKPNSCISWRQGQAAWEDFYTLK